MVAFVNVSITFNNQIILAGLLENTTCMPIPQKTADKAGNDSNLLIVFYVQIMPDDFVMQLHRF